MGPAHGIYPRPVCRAGRRRRARRIARNGVRVFQFADGPCDARGERHRRGAVGCLRPGRHILRRVRVRAGRALRSAQHERGNQQRCREMSRRGNAFAITGNSRESARTRIAESTTYEARGQCGEWGLANISAVSRIHRRRVRFQRAVRPASTSRRIEPVSGQAVQVRTLPAHFFSARIAAVQGEPSGSPFMRVLLLAIVFISLAAPTRAADDVAAAQGVIRSQVEAFSRDDAAAAYSHAAPAIQEIFPQADIFMSMVRNGYAPVYRHKSFDFGETRVSDGTIAQRVHIVDAAGIPWEALNTLELRPDGSVKITGCVLLRAGQAA